jgi:hypothetical protein
MLLQHGDPDRGDRGDRARGLDHLDQPWILLRGL